MFRPMAMKKPKMIVHLFVTMKSFEENWQAVGYDREKVQD